MGKLEGRVALITGGGRGIGRGLALAMAKEGAAIALAEWNDETGPATARELESLGARALWLHCDVTRRSQVDETVRRVVKTLGGLDILVNNATGARPEDSFRPFLQVDEDQIRHQLGVDVYGSIYCMQAAHAHLKQSPAGRVINLCSIAGTNRSAGFSIYATAKEGLRALTGAVAREWGRDGITVNALCPTARTEALIGWAEEHPEVAAAALASVPLARYGDPELDIGRVAVFIASDDSAFMTGHTFWVDGGSGIRA